MDTLSMVFGGLLALGVVYGFWRERTHAAQVLRLLGFTDASGNPVPAATATLQPAAAVSGAQAVAVIHSDGSVTPIAATAPPAAKAA